ADVGHDDVDTRRRGLAPEQYAAIDDDPLPVVGRAEAISVEIHPDLARSAERQEHKFVLHQIGRLALRAWISIRPRMVRSGSICSMAGMSGRNRCDRPPVATTVIGLPY